MQPQWRSNHKSWQWLVETRDLGVWCKNGRMAKGVQKSAWLEMQLWRSRYQVLMTLQYVFHTDSYFWSVYLESSIIPQDIGYIWPLPCDLASYFDGGLCATLAWLKLLSAMSQRANILRWSSPWRWIATEVLQIIEFYELHMIFLLEKGLHKKYGKNHEKSTNMSNVKQLLNIKKNVSCSLSSSWSRSQSKPSMRLGEKKIVKNQKVRKTNRVFSNIGPQRCNTHHFLHIISTQQIALIFPVYVCCYWDVVSG